jgi:hypothetical protein
MGLSRQIDITTDFNANGLVNLDISGWDNVIAQFITPAAAVTFKATNDGGDVTGLVDGNARSATNFTVVQGVDEATGTAATTTSTSTTYKFSLTAKYLQFSGTTAAKILVTFYKIF